MTTMDEFIDRLYACGWRSSADAQHQLIAPLFEEFRALERDRVEFWKRDEQIKMLRRMCKEQSAEGWQHIPILTIEIFTGGLQP